MHVLLIGGIYGMPQSFRETKLQATTETILEEHLRHSGFTVSTSRHRGWNSLKDVDLVHIHHLANGCLQFIVRRSVPVVFTRHATKQLPPHHRWVLERTLARANRIVVLSDAERSQYPEQWHDKIRVIRNGIDSTVFHPPAERQEPDPPWRLLYVGQVIELKRVHLCLRFMDYLRTRGLAAQLKIVTQRSTLLADVLRYAEGLELTRHVQVVDGLPMAEVADEMRNSHMLLLPSRSEGLSTVVTEACLSALPVLAFDVGGMKEQLPSVLEPPQPNDIDSWLELGFQMLANYADTSRTFLDHVPLVRERFSIRSMVQQHIALYNELAAGHA